MPKHIELLTKALAAERLGLSVRRVMELSGDGTFSRHRAYDPETRREAVMFDAAEVDAWKTANTPKPAPLLLAAPAGAIEPDDAGRGAGRLWLTLDEAAAFSGLPASYLFRMIEKNELAARDVGVRPGGRFRIRRLDLAAIEGHWTR